MVDSSVGVDVGKVPDNLMRSKLRIGEDGGSLVRTTRASGNSSAFERSAQRPQEAKGYLLQQYSLRQGLREHNAQKATKRLLRGLCAQASQQARSSIASCAVMTNACRGSKK
jgi:hypothetical protein